jgi:hypothetical protein
MCYHQVFPAFQQKNEILEKGSADVLSPIFSCCGSIFLSHHICTVICGEEGFIQYLLHRA